MRYLVGFVVVLVIALGLFSCGENTECTIAADCDDGNVCTAEWCVEFYCENRPRDRHIECNTPGGEDGYCADGICIQIPSCDDSDDCTNDHFYVPSESCEHTPLVSCEPCDLDGQVGYCVGGACSLNDPCDDVTCEGEGVPYCLDSTGWKVCVPTCDCGHCRDYCIDCLGGTGRCNEGYCDPETVECVVLVLDEGNCCNGVYCPDENPCTLDFCDPDTRECLHAPAPDGGSCCARWGPYTGFCLPGPCPDECYDRGHCQDGVCLAD